LAEIELKTEEEVFEIPNWIKEEVSHLKEYRNNYLAVNPFKNWEK
jgi:adenylate cyclase